MKKRKINIVESNKKCQYYILCAIDFYTQKGQSQITITDVQNFIQGYTFKELSENACILIDRKYINGEFKDGFKDIKMYQITEKGQKYFDEL